jgi:hypothetical protein
MGIITWDWTVSGLPRSSLLDTINVARVVGKLQLKGKQWEEETSLSKEHWEALFSRVDAITVQGEMCRIFPYDLEQSLRPVLFLASDAMNTKGAAVMMSAVGEELALITHAFPEELHKNHKETLKTLLATLRSYKVRRGAEKGSEETCKDRKKKTRS